jgi:hypothetical protein
MDNLFAVEKYHAARAELLAGGEARPGAPLCVFCDVMDCFSSRVRQQISRLEKAGQAITLEGMLPLVKSVKPRRFMAGGDGPIRSEMYCMRQRRLCPVVRAKLQVAGSPCVAWSSMGKLQKTKHESIVAFATWAAMRRSLNEAVIIHENVPAFEVPGCAAAPVRFPTALCNG